MLILGASTRAAAQSAFRAGYRPLCLDCFADEDLRQIAEIVPCDDYPAGIVMALRGVPRCPWMYTGALENQPRLIAELAAARPLLGNGAEALRRTRDPFHLRALLLDAALPALELRPETNPPPRDGHWICKPRRSGAGRGVMLWGERATVPREPHYFQRRAHGRGLSGLFIADAAKAQLLGISEQFSGWSAAHAPPFAYCGSMAPVSLATNVRDQILAIGAVCGQACALRGLFGIDFILEDEAPLLLEINPRYPASAELFESMVRQSLIALHADACAGSVDHQWRLSLDSPTALGKLILYAPCAVLAPDVLRHLPADGAAFELPEFADIPRPGTPVGKGDPICTLFASAGSIDACRAELARKAASCFNSWIA